MRKFLFKYVFRGSPPSILKYLILAFGFIGTSLLFDHRYLILESTGIRKNRVSLNIQDSILSDEMKCGSSRSLEERRSESLTRAIVTYFPVKQLNPYLGQLKWCLRSMLEMMKTEPQLWRTDIILFVEDDTLPEILELGCTIIPRTTRSESFKCVLVKYVKVRDRIITANSSVHERELKEQLKEYSFTDSIAPLAEQADAYLSYDVVVRSDLDVFFTPAFSSWVPPGCTFITGSGGFSDPYNLMKLALVANHSGAYFNSSIWNIGSTWVGPAPLIARIAARTVHWMVYLSKNEFTPTMRKQSWWSKAILWPEWHYGVLLLYGGQLAINEVLHAGKRYPFQKIDLDHPTTSTAECTEKGPIHLHTYQNDNYFSKYQFTSKKYEGSNSLPTMLNSTRCCDYAAYLAGDSLLMTASELAKNLKAVKEIK